MLQSVHLSYVLFLLQTLHVCKSQRTISYSAAGPAGALTKNPPHQVVGKSLHLLNSLYIYYTSLSRYTPSQFVKASGERLFIPRRGLLVLTLTLSTLNPQLRILVYLVTYASGQVSPEDPFHSQYPSQRGPASV